MDSMSWGRLRFRVMLLVVALVSSACVAQRSAADLDDRPVNPLASSPGKVVVLVFLRRDCPVSSRYAPSIQRVSMQYAESAIFWLIYPDKSETSDSIRKSIAEYGYHLPVLRDPEHQLVKLTHVPAGEKNFLVTDDFTLPVDVDLLAIYPHAHYLGKDIEAFAELIDGTKQSLIHIPQWNLNWQAVLSILDASSVAEGNKDQLALHLRQLEYQVTFRACIAARSLAADRERKP